MAELFVAPFFRASVTVDRAARGLFCRGLGEGAFNDGVARQNEILRQNLRRVFAAALLAEERRGRIVLVEGFSSNRVERPHRKDRFVTGSWVFALLLRLLRRRGLVVI